MCTFGETTEFVQGNISSIAFDAERSVYVLGGLIGSNAAIAFYYYDGTLAGNLPFPYITQPRAFIPQQVLNLTYIVDATGKLSRVPLPGCIYARASFNTGL